MDRKSNLYFEAHITIDPVFDARREIAEHVAQCYGFRLAKLIMRKQTADAEQPSKDDTFMTGHGQYLENIKERTRDCVKALQAGNFVVRRYKIEDTVLDSRSADSLGLLQCAPQS